MSIKIEKKEVFKLSLFLFYTYFFESSNYNEKYFSIN